MASNLAFLPASGIASSSWTVGLSSYTQGHCQCSLTENGYRIYRTPNKTYSGDGSVMWGGLVVKNTAINYVHPWDNSSDNIFGLATGHTYVICFHVKGKSTNPPECYWSNQIG